MHTVIDINTHVNFPLPALLQAEREDVVKWLVWSRADPAKRSGNLLKMAQDPG